MGSCQSAVAVPRRASSGRVDVLELLKRSTGPTLLAVQGAAKSPACIIMTDGRHAPADEGDFTDARLEEQGDYKACQGLGSSTGFVCKKGMKTLRPLPNQDGFFIAKSGGVSMYGVFDGHGPNGHHVSRFAAPKLMQHLLNDPHFKSSLRTALRDSFRKAHANVLRRRGKQYDCELSGTTAAVLVDTLDNFNRRQLTFAHVGHCQAIIGRQWEDSGSRRWEAMDIASPHLPSSQDEEARILASGGVVREEAGTHRVYAKNQLAPGLAMSRSIGDRLGAKVGVSCDPTIEKVAVHQDMKFVVLCTNGITAFISSQEVVAIAGQHMPSQAQKAADQLVAEAKQRWLREENTEVDDLTVICIPL